MTVRHLASTLDGDVVAAASFSRTVSTWQLSSLKHVATFDTVLEFGGLRLAVAPNSEVCAAAAYNREGVAAYSVAEGRELWRRRDLKRTEYLAFSPDGRLYCASDDRPCHILDASTGMTLEKLRGVRRAWHSPSGDCTLLDQTTLELQGPAGRSVGIPRSTFAVVEAAFCPGAICISESGGPVRCLDYDGKELWRYAPAAGRHVLSLAYDPNTSAVLGVEWPYEHGGPKRLLRLDFHGGHSRTVCILPSSPETAFIWRGGGLLLTDGSILDTASAAVVGTLGFDQLAEAGA